MLMFVEKDGFTYMYALVLSRTWSMLALIFVEQIGAGGRTKFSELLLLLMLVLE